MIDQMALRLALRSPYLANATLAALAMAWENQNFLPPDPVAPWVQETLLPGPETLAATKMLELTGIYQLTFFTITGGGTEKTEGRVKAAGDLYLPGTSINAQGLQIAIDRTWGGPAITMAGWYGKPLNIKFRVYGSVP